MRRVSNSITDRSPVAASVTYTHTTTGEISAICGERKLRSTASTFRLRQSSRVTAPSGLTTTAGPVGPAAIACGSGRCTRRSTCPPGRDTASSSFLLSAVTSATGVPPVRWPVADSPVSATACCVFSVLVLFCSGACSFPLTYGRRGLAGPCAEAGVRLQARQEGDGHSDAANEAEGFEHVR